MITSNEVQNDFLMEFNELLRKYRARLLINKQTDGDYMSIDIPSIIDNRAMVRQFTEINLGQYYDAELFSEVSC